MFDHDGTMFFGGGFMWIFWIVLIVLIFMGLKGLGRSTGSDNSSQCDSPMEILKKRYAQDEIDEEEFKRRRKALES